MQQTNLEISDFRFERLREFSLDLCEFQFVYTQRSEFFDFFTLVLKKTVFIMFQFEEIVIQFVLTYSLSYLI